MSPLTIWERIAGWLAYLPVRLAYRIIWAAARLNLGAARQVYAAMWDAKLALPWLWLGPHCPHCDDTGDVHRADGEWLGKCDCGARATRRRG